MSFDKVLFICFVDHPDALILNSVRFKIIIRKYKHIKKDIVKPNKKIKHTQKVKPVFLDNLIISGFGIVVGMFMC